MYVCSEMTLRTHAVYVIGERTRRAHDVRLVASAGRLVTPPVAGVWLASRTAAPTTGHSFTVTDAQAPAPAITP